MNKCLQENYYYAIIYLTAICFIIILQFISDESVHNK